MVGNKYSRPAEKDHAKVAAEKLRVSFEYLDLSLPEFFIHGLAADHYRKIFDCVNTIADATEDEIVQQKHASLVSKSIFNTDGGTYKRFPENLEAAIAAKLTAKPKAGAPLEKVISKSAEEVLADAKKQAQKIVGRAFEVRVGKAYGRIHGIVWDKVFYVVWFDPAHNLYPTQREGIRLHDAFAAVKCFSPETVAALKEAHQEHCDQLGFKFDELNAAHEELMLAWADK